MRAAVLDSSVVLKWIRGGEVGTDAALALLDAFRAGGLEVRAPTLLGLEILNTAARSWRWPPEDVRHLGDEFGLFGIRFVEPEWERVAEWAAQGLTAYDAAYVAIAEAAGIPLVTVDEEILALAPHVARRLGDDW